MENLEKRLDRAEEDIKELKKIWSILSKIDKRQVKILTKFEDGHSCKHEKEIISLTEFKNNASEDMKTSISRNQTIIFIIFASLISFLLGYISKTI